MIYSSIILITYYIYIYSHLSILDLGAQFFPSKAIKDLTWSNKCCPGWRDIDIWSDPSRRWLQYTIDKWCSFALTIDSLYYVKGLH